MIDAHLKITTTPLHSTSFRFHFRNVSHSTEHCLKMLSRRKM